MLSFNNEYLITITNRTTKKVVFRDQVTAHNLNKAMDKASKVAADNGYGNCLEYQVSVKEK